MAMGTTWIRPMVGLPPIPTQAAHKHQTRETMNLSYRIVCATIMAVLFLPSCSMAQLQVVSDIEETFVGIDEIIIHGGSLEVTYEGSEKEEVFLNAYLESNNKNGHESSIGKKAAGVG